MKSEFLYDRDEISERYGGKDHTVYVKISDLVSGFNELDWKTFRIIVSKGISEEKEAIETVIDDLIVEDRICHSKDSVWRSVKRLTGANLLKSNRIHTGYRPLNVLQISEVGRMAYMQTFKKNPARFECEKMVSDHNSILHGYMIKDVKHILNQFGYETVTTGRKENVIHLYDGGGFCIPDVIVHGKPAKYFEVECGNHNQYDFDEKCDRLKIITNKLYFIVRSRSDAKVKLLPQIESWVKKNRGTLRFNNIKVYLTSMRDLANNSCTYIFDPHFDEPICCVDKKRKEEKDDA